MISSSSGRSRTTSALYASPMDWKYRTASSRSQTSRVMGSSRATISRLRASAPPRLRASAPPRLQRLDVGRREGFVAREVVGEPVPDRGADGHLDVRVEFLRGIGEGVRGVVANESKDLGIRSPPRPDLVGAVLSDGARELAERTVEADGARGVGEAGRDLSRGVLAGDRAGVGALDPVGERERRGFGVGGHGPGSRVPGVGR